MFFFARRAKLILIALLVIALFSFSYGATRRKKLNAAQRRRIIVTGTSPELADAPTSKYIFNHGYGSLKLLNNNGTNTTNTTNSTLGIDVVANLSFSALKCLVTKYNVSAVSFTVLIILLLLLFLTFAGIRQCTDLTLLNSSIPQCLKPGKLGLRLLTWFFLRALYVLLTQLLKVSFVSRFSFVILLLQQLALSNTQISLRWTSIIFGIPSAVLADHFGLMICRVSVTTQQWSNDSTINAAFLTDYITVLLNSSRNTSVGIFTSKPIWSFPSRVG